MFAVANDPVALGLVASLSRPGGNATGVSFQIVELVPKQLGMLHELVPAANRFVALLGPNSAITDAAVVKDLQMSASVLGLPMEILRAGTGREIDAAFAKVVQKAGGALLVGPDPFLPTGARKSSRWRRVTRYPRSITRLNLPRSAD